MTKGEMILELIRKSAVNGLIVVHNLDGSIWCMLKVIAKEHPEDTGEDDIDWNADNLD